MEFLNSGSRGGSEPGPRATVGSTVTGRPGFRTAAGGPYRHRGRTVPPTATMTDDDRFY